MITYFLSTVPLLVRLSPYLVIALVFLAAIWIISRRLRQTARNKKQGISNSFCGSCHGCSVSNCASRKNDAGSLKEI